MRARGLRSAHRPVRDASRSAGGRWHLDRRH
jgi:hypothetical protein